MLEKAPRHLLVALCFLLPAYPPGDPPPSFPIQCPTVPLPLEFLCFFKTGCTCSSPTELPWDGSSGSCCVSPHSRFIQAHGTNTPGLHDPVGPPAAGGGDRPWGQSLRSRG